MTEYCRDSLALITGNGNPSLAQAIADQLGIELAETIVESFRGGECRVQVLSDVRRYDVYIVQPTGQLSVRGGQTVSDRNEKELELLVRSVRPSAQTVTMLIP